MTHPLWPLFDLRIRSEHLVLRLPTDDELDRPCRAGPIRHPRRGRDAVRGAVVDAAEPRVRDRIRPAPLDDAWRRGRPRNGGSTWPSSGTASSSPPRRSRPKASRSTTWSTPARGSPGGSSGRGSARRCGARSWRSPSTISVPSVAESEAFLDNAASNAVSQSLGYEPNGFGRLAPEGVSRETAKYRMTRAVWEARPRPTVEVDGLDRCRALFGI